MAWLGLTLPMALRAGIDNCDVARVAEILHAVQETAYHGKLIHFLENLDGELGQLRARISYSPRDVGFGSRHQRRIDLYLPNGSSVAMITYNADNPGMLMIGDVYIGDRWRKNRLSSILIGAILIQYPRTREITATIGDTNWRVFEAALTEYSGNGPVTSLLGYSDEALLEAIRATPAYRARAPYGFTHIHYFSTPRTIIGLQGQRIFLTVRKP